MSQTKTLKWLSYLCLVVGFILPFVGSGFIGMSLSKRPVITWVNAVLWALGLILGYVVHVREKRYPASTPGWIKIANFLVTNPATIVFMGLLWGYVYYPTMEKSLITQYVTVPLMLSLFVCGIQISKENWKGIVQQPRFVAIGVVIRWIAGPACAYFLGHAILARFLPEPGGRLLAIGMVILATTPTGPASNTMTLISRGDLALSVSVTAMNNVLAPFLQPFLIALLVGSFVGHVNTHAIFIELIEMVLAPVILGSIVGGFYPELVKKVKPALGAIAVLCLSFIMLANISKGSATLLKQLWIIPWMVGACAVQACVVLSVGFYLPKLFGFTVKQRVATTFEVAVENASLATVLAMNHFSPLAALPAIFYGKFQHVFGIGIFVRKFQNMPELAEEAQPVPIPAAAQGRAVASGR